MAGKLAHKVGNHSFPTSGPIYVISTSLADEKYASALLGEKIISFDWILGRNEEKRRDEILYIFVCTFSALYEWNLQKFNGIPRGLADVLWNKDVLKCVPAAKPQNLEILTLSGFKLPTTLYGKFEGLILEMELHINGIRAMDLANSHSTSQWAHQIKSDLDSFQRRDTSKWASNSTQNPSENEFQLAISALQVFTASDEGKEFFANISIRATEPSRDNGRASPMPSNNSGQQPNDSMVGLQSSASGYAPRPANLLAPTFSSAPKSSANDGDHHDERMGAYYNSGEEINRYGASSPAPRLFDPSNGMNSSNSVAPALRSSSLESIGSQNRSNLMMTPYPSSSAPESSPNFDTLKFLYSLWGLEEPVVNLKPGEAGKWHCTLNAAPFVSTPCVGYQIQSLLDLSALDILKQLKPAAQEPSKPQPPTLPEKRPEPVKAEPEPSPPAPKVSVASVPSYARYPEPKPRLAPFPKPANEPVRALWPKQFPPAFLRLANAVFARPRWVPMILLLAREKGHWRIEIRISGFERYKVTYPALNIIEALELTALAWIEHEWDALRDGLRLSAPLAFPHQNDGFLRLNDARGPPPIDESWDNLMTKVLEHVQYSKFPIRLFPSTGEHEALWRIGYITELEPVLPSQKFLEVALRELIRNQLTLKPQLGLGSSSAPQRTIEIKPGASRESKPEKNNVTKMRDQLLNFVSQANAKVGRAKITGKTAPDTAPAYEEPTFEAGSPMAAVAEMLRKSSNSMPSMMPFYFKCLYYILLQDGAKASASIYIERCKNHWKVSIQFFNFATLRSAKGWGNESPDLLESLENAAISLIREHWDTLRHFDIFSKLSSAPEAPKTSIQRAGLSITGIDVDWEGVYEVLRAETGHSSFAFRLYTGKLWYLSMNAKYRTDSLGHFYLEAAVARVLAAVFQSFAA